MLVKYGDGARMNRVIFRFLMFHDFNDHLVYLFVSFGGFSGVFFEDRKGECWKVLYCSIALVLHSIGFCFPSSFLGVFVGVVGFQAITIGTTTASHGRGIQLIFSFVIYFSRLNPIYGLLMDSLRGGF